MTSAATKHTWHSVTGLELDLKNESISFVSVVAGLIGGQMVCRFGCFLVSSSFRAWQFFLIYKNVVHCSNIAGFYQTCVEALYCRRGFLLLNSIAYFEWVDLFVCSWKTSRFFHNPQYQNINSLVQHNFTEAFKKRPTRFIDTITL